MPCVNPRRAAALLPTPSGCVRFACSGVGRGPWWPRWRQGEPRACPLRGAALIDAPAVQTLRAPGRAPGALLHAGHRMGGVSSLCSLELPF